MVSVVKVIKRAALLTIGVSFATLGLVGAPNLAEATPAPMFQELHIGVEVPLGDSHPRRHWHRRRRVVVVEPAPIIIEHHDDDGGGRGRGHEHHDNGKHKGQEKHEDKH